MHYFVFAPRYTFTINYRHATFFSQFFLSLLFSLCFSVEFFSFVCTVPVSTFFSAAWCNDKRTIQTINNRIRIHIVTNYLRSIVTDGGKEAAWTKGWMWKIGKIHLKSFTTNECLIRHTKYHCWRQKTLLNGQNGTETAIQWRFDFSTLEWTSGLFSALHAIVQFIKILESRRLRMRS